MSALNLYRCTPRQTRIHVLECLEADLVPFVQSSPGLGKSSIMRSIAEELNLKIIDHRLSTSAPEDLSGLPHFIDVRDEEGNIIGKQAQFAPFADLFPIAGTALPIKTKAVKDDQGNITTPATYYNGWLLFLDEFNSASKAVQAASYKLILDRMLGQYHLHEKVWIAAAGNLATDRAIVNPIGTAMQSRVAHIEMNASFDDWLYDVAIPQKYDNRIVAFLSQYPERLMNFKPDHQDKTFCCPR